MVSPATPALRGTATGTGSTITTGSFTPTAGDVLYAAHDCVASSGAMAEGVISDTAGLTWSRYNSGTAGATSNRVSVYWAQVGNSPASMTVTATAGTGTLGSQALVVVSIGRADPAATTSTKKGLGNSTTGDPSVTLGSAPDAASTLLGFWMGPGAVAVTAPTNFTAITDLHSGTQAGIEAAYDALSGATTNAYSTTGTNAGAWFGEIIAAVFSAAITGTLVPATGALTVRQAIKVAITGTLKQATGSITAREAFKASLAGTLKQATGSITALERFRAAITGTLVPVAGSIAAKERFIATVAGTLQPASGSIAAKERFIAAITGTATAMSGALAAKERFIGSVAGALVPTTGALAVTNTAPAAGTSVAIAGTLQPVQGSLSVTVTAAVQPGETPRTVAYMGAGLRKARREQERRVASIWMRLPKVRGGLTVRVSETDATRLHRQIIADDERILELLDA